MKAEALFLRHELKALFLFMQIGNSSSSNKAVSASLAAYFTSCLKKNLKNKQKSTFYSVLMVFQSVMAFHMPKIVVKIHVGRNKMGEHQIQVPGLDFKFQIAAPKHLIAIIHN